MSMQSFSRKMKQKTFRIHQNKTKQKKPLTFCSFYVYGKYALKYLKNMQEANKNASFFLLTFYS